MVVPSTHDGLGKIKKLMKKYSSDKNALMLLALMKAHGVKKVIASPGTTNVAIVGSMQHDSFFEMFSSVDERSAAYMACGMAAESGEPVAIICTGATASRNYLPGLTEAYYRKLPVLAICGSHGEGFIGHLNSQVVDRTQSPKDTVLFSAFINPITSSDIAWYNNVEINKALIKLTQRGGGPVLINIVAGAYKTFTEDELPISRVIRYSSFSDKLPIMPNGRIALFIGAHVQMSEDLQKSIDSFCASCNGVVFCDNTSGYQGTFRFRSSLVYSQSGLSDKIKRPDLLIHIGEVSGDTYTTGNINPKEVWRVSPDGEVRDLFRKLCHVFEMKEIDFFKYYTKQNIVDKTYYEECIDVLSNAQNNLEEMQFGNIYIASVMAPILPKNCVIHFGIYNSLRSWNMFDLDSTIHSSCNVGGFGIDGACSTLLGAALCNPNKLYFLCVGDLAFFYDLNSLGNRHLPSNIRILLINNGRGVEFRKKDHPGSRFGMDADLFISAADHYGKQSLTLVKHYAEDLGFEYKSASTKEELNFIIDWFVSDEKTNYPKFLETFVPYVNDVENLDSIRHMADSTTDKLMNFAKDTAKKILR